MKRIFLMMIALLLALPAGGFSALAEDSTMDKYNGYQLRYGMLKTLYEQNGQFVVSPMSLSIALSMAIAGASGETKGELENALGLGNSIHVLTKDAYEQLQFANAAIVSDRITLLDNYKNALKEQFDAELMLMDNNLLPKVNEWINEKTDGMIPQFLTEQPDESLRLLLLNALVFDAKWRTPFDPANTDSGTFHTPDVDVKTEFMYAARSMEYAEGMGAQAVRLPYAATDDNPDPIEMILILPQEDGLEMTLSRMGETQLDWLGEWRRASEVQLSMPKLAIESTLDLKPILEEAGVHLAFSEEADFSGMTGDQYLYLDGVLQKVRLDIDEDGTKAAAATGMFLAGKALVFDSIEMMVNRPFIVLVQSRQTEATLFAAVITDPTRLEARTEAQT